MNISLIIGIAIGAVFSKFWIAFYENGKAVAKGEKTFMAAVADLMTFKKSA
jgi:hypothetical protein